MGQFILNRKARFFPVLCVFTLVLLTWGCGTDTAPVAAGDDATRAQSADSRLLLAFAPDAAQAAKLTQDGRTVSAEFNAHGGQLKVEEFNGDGERDDLLIRLKAGNGALGGPVDISMTVYGQTLSSLVMEFQPGGLEFLDPAELRVDLGLDKVDMSLADLKIWHIHDDGTVEEAVVELQMIEPEDNSGGDPDLVRIIIEVPGFSRYSPGGNPDP